MALQDIIEQHKKDAEYVPSFIQSDSNIHKVGVSMERLEAVKPILRKYISFWRAYPDLFIDFLVKDINGNYPPGCFQFYAYQRAFLRACMRYKYVYATYPRAYSKSFLVVLVSMVRCILYPGLKVATAAGGKEQSASILKSKCEELCKLIPALDKEIDRKPGRTREGKDQVHYVFKSGSHMENLAASEKTRGAREHSLIAEECVGIDGDILSKVLIPTLNVSRRSLDGTIHNEEPVNKSQIYISKNSGAIE